MSSVNKVILMGRLGRDPEFRQAGAKEVASMSLATDETFKDKNGERQKKTQWHRLTSWISIPFIREYLHSGDSIYVEGKIEYREWTDKEGNKKWATDINVTDIKPISTARTEENRPAARSTYNPTQHQAARAQGQGVQVADDDIPF
jgi:single-strand DNA-binding protein